MKWVIWVVLAVFSATVLAVVFSGGLVDDSRRKETPIAPAATSAPSGHEKEPGRGSMAYDRFLPGGRQSDAEP